MDQGTLQGIATILAMVAFLGVCWWAYSGHKKQDFEEASQLPFADDATGSEGPASGKSMVSSDSVVGPDRRSRNSPLTPPLLAASRAPL